MTWIKKLHLQLVQHQAQLSHLRNISSRLEGEAKHFTSLSVPPHPLVEVPKTVKLWMAKRLGRAALEQGALFPLLSGALCT